MEQFVLKRYFCYLRGKFVQIIQAFLRFRPRIRFICERSAENETMQFGRLYGFGSVSVRIRCICETALKLEEFLKASGDMERTGKRYGWVDG